MAQQTVRTAEELEEEFKNILKKIHPYFKALKSNNRDTSLCQKWLHKLFKTDKNDMKIRNDYLSELLKQLKNGKLNDPFTKPPKKKGLLLPLPIRTHMSMQNFQIGRRTTTKKKLYNSVWDVLNYESTTGVDHEFTENCVNLNGHNIEEIEEKDDFNYKQLPYFFDISENSKSQQLIKPTADKSEGGDGCALNRKTKTMIESFGKITEKLQMNNDLLESRLHEVELNTSNSDRMKAEIIAELTKVERDLEAMNDRENLKSSEDSKIFNFLVEKTAQVDQQIDQFKEVTRDLRSVIEDACDHTQIIADMMKSIEYLKERHRAQSDVKNGHVEEQIDAFESKADELQTPVDFNRRDAADATAAAGTPRVNDEDDGGDDEDDGGDDDDDDNNTIIS